MNCVNRTGWTIVAFIILFLGICSLSVAMGLWQGDAAGWGLFGGLLLLKAIFILLIVNAPPSILEEIRQREND